MTSEQQAAREQLKALGVRLGRPYKELWERAIRKRRTALARKLKRIGA